jgi:Lysine methyltransferase
MMASIPSSDAWAAAPVESNNNNEIHEIDRNEANISKEEEESEEDLDELFDRRYSAYFQSIRSRTGLEIGIHVSWPRSPTGDRNNSSSNIVVDPTSSGNQVSGDSCCFELSTCLSQDCLAPLFHGTQWAGTRIWRASVVTLEYLLSEEFEIESRGTSDTKLGITRDHNVLELGCGLGVPGMVLHALRDCRVVLTDMGDLVDTLQANLDKAFPSLIDADGASSGSPSRITAHALDWSRPEAVDELLKETGLTQFDIVVNCDCIFEPLYGESWKYLLDCQVALLKNNPSSYVLTSVERRKFDGIDKYLQQLVEAGVRVEQIRPTTFEYPPQVELYRLHLLDSRGTSPSHSSSLEP